MSQSTEVSSRKQNPTNDWQSHVIRPAVDIFENAEGITLKADMPGVSKERLDIRVEGTACWWKARSASKPAEMSALYADMRSTIYRRSFAIGNELESEKSTQACAMEC